jgi:benzodiazapine receptor
VNGSIRIWIGLAAWIGITFLAAAVGSRFQPGTWYADLAKPAWTPPNVIFAPVWTLLYLLMGISAWLVWRGVESSATGLPLAVYVLQLAVNAAWSWLFFGLHQIGWALVDIVVLWGLIALTLWLFWRQSATAGLLLVPYLLWVSYAAVLNLELFRRNI